MYTCILVFVSYLCGCALVYSIGSLIPRCICVGNTFLLTFESFTHVEYACLTPRVVCGIFCRLAISVERLYCFFYQESIFLLLPTELIVQVVLQMMLCYMLLGLGVPLLLPYLVFGPFLGSVLVVILCVQLCDLLFLLACSLFVGCTLCVCSLMNF